jgi:hypothetical protein
MKITKSQLNQIIKEEIKAVMGENGGNPDVDPSIEPGEPVDITAGMSDDEVEKLANELSAAAQAMGAESYEWYPDDDEW